MKKEARLPILIDRIQSGQLSRNKHFEAYRDPMVREARRRSARLGKLRRVLVEAESGEWEFMLQNSGEDAWLLHCRSDKLNLSWTAKLQFFELEMLREEPRVRHLLDTRPLISPAFA